MKEVYFSKNIDKILEKIDEPFQRIQPETIKTDKDDLFARFLRVYVKTKEYVMEDSGTRMHASYFQRNSLK